MIRPLETPCWTASDDRGGKWHYRKATRPGTTPLTARERAAHQPGGHAPAARHGEIAAPERSSLAMDDPHISAE
jgi:hypothetical protein